MSKLINSLTLGFAKGVVKWRWLVLLFSVVAVLALASGGRFLAFTSDYRVFFGEDNPQLQAYDGLQDIYTKTDNVLLVIKPNEGTVFTNKWLQVIQQVTEDSWQVPYSIRVDSLSNFQHTIAEEDDLIVADLVEEAGGLTNAQLKEIEAVAQREPVLARRLISEDSKTTGINITLQLPEDDQIALTEAVEYAEGMAASIEKQYPELEVAVTGRAPLSNSFPRASQKDMGSLIPIMFGIIVLALVGFLRSISGTIVTLMVIILSVMSAMGFAGHTGVKLTPPSAMAPIIILTIAIADCVHILITMLHEMRMGRTKHEAIVESLRVNTQPVLLTSFTTVIGFLSLNFSDSPPFGDLGNIAAAGVVAAWVLSMTFLPAVAAIIPFRVKEVKDDASGFMSKFAEFVLVHRTKLLVGMTAVVVIMIAQIPRIELDDRFVEYFDHSIPFRVDSDFARENLTGIYDLEFSVGAVDSGGISDPEYLAKLEEFTLWLRDQPGVVHVNVFTDVMKRLNKSMHGDDESYYKVPEGRELAAQYLLLYEMSLPYGLDLNSQINVDKSATRVSVTLDNVSSENIRSLAVKGSEWLKLNAPEYMYADGSGASVMFAHIADRNIKSMLIGTALAFVLISISMVVALGSLRIGLISLIPNMLPAAMAFGLWGVFVGQVGLAVSVIAATSLGLIVDASVHFLSKYVRARRERGESPEDAVRYSFKTVGMALWVTTAVLMMGFGVLFFSSFSLNADMGLLTAITIAIALAVDFLLLPPLLLLLGGKKPMTNAVPQAAD
ncbi:efflux RND transporter permease subunit [Curvivirga aplysinae]|uniref:efflux RND transporter permease subunit n=1 Tax=Curvivirga aplysinae TaxID=2529852 RepID=UPI0012BC3F49|nr:MMPL family transporter [Curvivirga aplysinae]MTI10369.1 RND family transporter [Curvivirga aplysinae]